MRVTCISSRKRDLQTAGSAFALCTIPLCGDEGLNFAGLCFLRLNKIADRAVPDRGLLGLLCGGE